MSKDLEDLIEGLFRERKYPYFDGGKLSYELIGEFAKDQEAQRRAEEFISELQKIWKKRFPGKALPILANAQTPSLTVPLVQAPATGGSVTTQPTSSDAGNTVPPAATSATPAASPTGQASASVQPASPADVSNAYGLKPGQVPSAPAKPAAIPESAPTFHLPNCKVGTVYSAKIEGTAKAGRSIEVVDLRFPDGLGLTFDATTQMVTGQPLLDGEFALGLQWSFVDTPGSVSGTCMLTSNPDPKSLWKVIEPADDLPYRKAHLDQKFLNGKGFSIAAASRRGRSHEHGGSFRDDDFFISDDQSNGWSVMIVADGAGSAKYSREGSRIAVETAGKHLVDSLAGEFGAKISGLLGAWDSDATSQQTIGTEFHYFFHKMAGNAIQAIEQEAQAQNAPVKEYSTTLLVAAVKKEGTNTFLATFWMGDGAIAAYGPRGTVKLMGTPDGGEFAGQTRFLDRNALADQGFGKRVRVGCLQNVSSVILMTDGVSDPYFETDNGLAEPAKWDVLWDEIQPQLADATPEQRLIEWLHFFKQGHHDDRTIALLW